MADSVNTDQTTPSSILTRVYTVCFDWLVEYGKAILMFR